MKIKNLFYPQSIAGFSLIELMIVIAIMGILGTIAFPLYKNHIQSSRRTDAMSALIHLEAAEESYRFSNAGYGTLTQLQASTSGITNTSSLGYYDLTVAPSTPTTVGYTLTATATGAQAADTACATMQISLNNGVETKTPPACWTGY
jgi:type IV pilus assembly protein PilE